MAQHVREIMTTDPITCPADTPVADAARAMREQGIGDVIVLDDGHVAGILTDRDIAVRVVAEGSDPTTVAVGEVCSRDLVALAPDDPVDHAVEAMRDRAIRRLPVVDDDRPVGVVSIGDLARERDDQSALADISSAPPNT